MALCRLAGLDTLDFGACLILTDAHLAAIPAGGWDRIRNVNISRCWGITQVLGPAPIASQLEPHAPLQDVEPEPEPVVVAVEPVSHTSSDAAQASATRLSRVERLDTAPTAPSASALRVLNAHGCEGLTDIAGLGHSSASLTGLDIGACAGVTDLSVLATLTNLRVLRYMGHTRARVPNQSRARLTCLSRPSC